jgi:hypothetical protein
VRDRRRYHGFVSGHSFARTRQKRLRAGGASHRPWWFGAQCGAGQRGAVDSSRRNRSRISAKPWAVSSIACLVLRQSLVFEPRSTNTALIASCAARARCTWPTTPSGEADLRSREEQWRLRGAPVATVDGRGVRGGHRHLERSPRPCSIAAPVPSTRWPTPAAWP